MSTNPLYCFEDQGITEAAKLMEAQQVRRLSVLNRRNRLVGSLPRRRGGRGRSEAGGRNPPRSLEADRPAAVRLWKGG
jgi:hypothetical protein